MSRTLNEGSMVAVSIAVLRLDEGERTIVAMSVTKLPGRSDPVSVDRQTKKV